MPQFDLRGMKIAKYVNTSGTITYTGATSLGEAMTADIELKYAEGRIYCESRLAEYLKKPTGGTISMGVKYIPDDAQKLMFGATEGSETISSKTVKSLKYGASNVPAYVGVAFYAPDMVDGTEKYFCMFISKALFAPPSMSMKTLGDSISFNTPTTTGEFMADNSTSQDMFETAYCESVADAEAWVTEKLK